MKIECFFFFRATGRIQKCHCWVIIEADPFSESDQERFKRIASYLLGCDEIQTAEIENLIDKIAKLEKKVANGDGEKVAVPNADVLKSPPRAIIEYPLNVRGASSVTVQSYECLAVGEYLDDAIIDFYAEYLRHEMLSAEQRERTHIFSVFFYNVLTARSSRGRFTTPGLSAAQKRHERVAKWTKEVDIFEKDFLIVPINTRNHWFLAIVCYPSLEFPIYMDTGKPVPTKKRRSTSTPDDSKPVKQ